MVFDRACPPRLGDACFNVDEPRAAIAWRHSAQARTVFEGMLPKHHRLRSERDFREMYRRVRPLYSTYFSLRYAKNSGLHARFGIVVSKRLSRDAAHRNRVKRRVRSILQQFLPLITPGVDLLLVVNPPIQDATFQDISDDLAGLLKRAHLLSTSYA